MSSKLEREGDRFAAKYKERLLRGLWLLNKNLGIWQEDDIMIEKIVVRAPKFEGGDVMVIVKGVTGNRRVVAFHNESDPGLAIAGALTRFEERELTWREDKYPPAG